MRDLMLFKHKITQIERKTIDVRCLAHKLSKGVHILI